MATPTPTPPAGGAPPTGGTEIAAQATFKGAADFFKKIFGINLDTVVQLGAPKLRRDAEKRAKDAKRKYPVDHPLRSDGAEIVFNILTANLKSAALALPNTKAMAVLKTAVREAAEYIDAFVQEFCNEENGEARKGSSKAMEAETKEAFSKLQGILAEYGGYIARDTCRIVLETPPSRMQETSKAMVERAEAYNAFANALQFGPTKKEKLKVPFGERMERFNEIMERELGPAVKYREQKIKERKAMTAALKEKQKQEAVARTPSGMDRFLKKLARVLFGFPKSTT